MEGISHFTRLPVVLGVIAILASGQASAQPRVVDQHHIASGNAFGIASDPYFARTPYTIVWRAEKSNQLFEMNGKVVRLKDVRVDVYDVESGKIVASSGWKPLSSEMQVPMGGKHSIRVYAPGKWTADFKEDKEALILAAKRGELKDGVTVEDAKATSRQTRKEQMEGLKVAMLRKIAASRKEIGEDGMAALIADVNLAAQLASDEDDFAARFEKLSAKTVERFQSQPLPAPTPPSPEQVVETPDANRKPASTWTGKGLPPGMRRVEKKVK